ncbi:hypothetical protein KQI42_01430 [Tissierella sp. MSJ-40]|uniref:Uncharacterized protein n=1 Tax=Tissierella simiarum TaxID=2841534 RepID=A0ABS6E1H7_9FIRM|nr:hypothetical protein [Tissierella simiarum]MBU5436647.1 hypothetical protein [Tissierella simiarum]
MENSNDFAEKLYDMVSFGNIQQEYTHKRFLEVIKSDKKNLNFMDDFSEE